MCGFAALFDSGRNFSSRLLDTLEEDLRHRGPDSGGQRTSSGWALVFRRLAILDTSNDADQPMSDTSGRYTIVFNGEIYNYCTLRSELIAKGHQFRTSGDTEVLLHGFMEWGHGVLDRLEGMYAFVIVDNKEQIVTAARDPFGIKPLYVARHRSLIAFASEMRPLRRLIAADPDPNALAELLLFRFAAGPLSNLTGIKKLPGGIVVNHSLDGTNYTERRFFDVLNLLGHAENLDEREALLRVESTVRNSVGDHLASDVGYAIQLSGGLDSGIVAALTAEKTGVPPHTFSIGLGNTPHDEGFYRKEVIRLTKPFHREYTFDGTDFAEAFPRAVAHMEGPSPHLGCVLLMLLCDHIRTTTKVVLTGEGADEMFGGYERYAIWRDLRKYGRFARLVPDLLWPLLHRYKALRPYAQHDPAVYASVFVDYLELSSIFPEIIARPGVRENAAARFSDFRDRLYAVDQTAYLESLLLRQDKMAMAAGVEARVPFTHLPLARVINRLPHSLKTPGDVTKPLLKKFAEQFFSTDFVHRRKVGLTLPLAEWLSDPNGLGRFLDYLTDINSRLVSYGERKKIRMLVNRFHCGDLGVARALIHLINIELWLRSLDETVQISGR